MHASFLHDTLYPVLFIINKFANICIPSLIHAPSQGHTVILVLCVRALGVMRDLHNRGPKAPRLGKSCITRKE